MLDVLAARCCRIALIVSIALPVTSRAQARAPKHFAADSLAGRRPIPGAVLIPPNFRRAIANGTRTRTGAPGPRNWVQHARYSIDASIDPATNTLTGREHVVYLNNSPDTLTELAVYLRQNVFRAGSPRRDEAPTTDGMTLSRVDYGGTALEAKPDVDALRGGPGYAVNGTVMWLVPPSPVLPHDSASLDFAWSYVPPLSRQPTGARDATIISTSWATGIRRSRSTMM